MDQIGIVFSLEGTLQGSALLVDLGLIGVHALIGHSHGHIIMPVVLRSGGDTDLQVQRQVRVSLSVGEVS